jgi:hypothetical protein
MDIYLTADITANRQNKLAGPSSKVRFVVTLIGQPGKAAAASDSSFIVVINWDTLAELNCMSDGTPAMEAEGYYV